MTAAACQRTTVSVALRSSLLSADDRPYGGGGGQPARGRRASSTGESAQISSRPLGLHNSPLRIILSGRGFSVLGDSSVVRLHIVARSSPSPVVAFAFSTSPPSGRPQSLRRRQLFRSQRPRAHVAPTPHNETAAAAAASHKTDQGPKGLQPPAAPQRLPAPIASFVALRARLCPRPRPPNIGGGGAELPPAPLAAGVALPPPVVYSSVGGAYTTVPYCPAKGCEGTHGFAGVAASNGEQTCAASLRYKCSSCAPSFAVSTS